MNVIKTKILKYLKDQKIEKIIFLFEDFLLVLDALGIPYTNMSYENIVELYVPDTLILQRPQAEQGMVSDDEVEWEERGLDREDGFPDFRRIELVKAVDYFLDQYTELLPSIKKQKQAVTENLKALLNHVNEQKETLVKITVNQEGVMRTQEFNSLELLKQGNRMLETLIAQEKEAVFDILKLKGFKEANPPTKVKMPTYV